MCVCVFIYILGLTRGQAEYVICLLVAAAPVYVNMYSTRRPVTVHVEYAERGKEYGILFIVRLFCEYTRLEYKYIPGIYRVNQAEHGIHIPVVAPQVYVKISTGHTHTHTHRQITTPLTPTHTHTTRTTPQTPKRTPPRNT